MTKLLNRDLWKYVGRFSLVHVITYLIAGLIFMNLQNYGEAFSTMASFEHFRPLDSPIVMAGPLLQFIRGGFLALLLYPFYDVIVSSRRGWLKLFGVLWGLTFIGSVAAMSGSIEGIIYTKTPLVEHLVGLPEVTAQMLAFSWLFVFWERRAYAKKISVTAESA